MLIGLFEPLVCYCMSMVTDKWGNYNLKHEGGYNNFPWMIKTNMHNPANEAVLLQYSLLDILITTRIFCVCLKGIRYFLAELPGTRNVFHSLLTSRSCHVTVKYFHVNTLSMFLFFKWGWSTKKCWLKYCFLFIFSLGKDEFVFCNLQCLYCLNFLRMWQNFSLILYVIHLSVLFLAHIGCLIFWTIW